MIDRIVEKEKQVIEMEKYLKKMQREETQKVLKSIKNRSGEIAAY